MNRNKKIVQSYHYLQSFYSSCVCTASFALSVFLDYLLIKAVFSYQLLSMLLVCHEIIVCYVSFTIKNLNLSIEKCIYGGTLSYPINFCPNDTMSIMTHERDIVWLKPKLG